MHTHIKTQCNNFQFKIANRTDFIQQFTLQFYTCLVMWNVNRSQKRLDFLLHQVECALCVQVDAFI